MTGKYPPKGLLVNLALPSVLKPKPEDFAQLLAMLHGKISALLIEPQLWLPTTDVREYLTNFVENCLDVIDPDLTLLLMITGTDAAETKRNFLELRKILRKISKKRIIYFVDLPLAYHSNRGLPEFYKDLLHGTDMPLILMNDPARLPQSKPFYKRKNLMPGVLKKLTKTPNICGLINVSNVKQSLDYSRILANVPGFRMYDGSESFFLENPNKTGVLSITANLFPSSWQSIVHSSVGMYEDINVPEKVRERWIMGCCLQEIAKKIKNHAPVFIRCVLNHWGIFNDPPGWLQDSQCETRALHFVKNYPEPDQILVL